MGQYPLVRVFPGLPGVNSHCAARLRSRFRETIRDLRQFRYLSSGSGEALEPFSGIVCAAVNV